MFADIIHVISNLNSSQFYSFLLGLCVGIAATHYIEKYFAKKIQKLTLQLHESEIASLKSQHQLQISTLKNEMIQLEQQNIIQQTKNEKEIAILQTKLQKVLHDTTQTLHCVPNNQKAYTFLLIKENDNTQIRCENLQNDKTCKILQKTCIKLPLSAVI